MAGEARAYTGAIAAFFAGKIVNGVDWIHFNNVTQHTYEHAADLCVVKINVASVEVDTDDLKTLIKRLTGVRHVRVVLEPRDRVLSIYLEGCIDVWNKVIDRQRAGGIYRWFFIAVILATVFYGIINAYS